MVELDLAGTVEGRKRHGHLHGGSLNGNRMYHRHSIQASAKVYGAFTYGHHEAEALSVAHGSPAMDGSSCNNPAADKPNRHCHVHDNVHGRMFDRASVCDHSAKPTLAKAEAWQVELAPGDSEILVRGAIGRHDLANSNVHGRTSILCSPLCLDVVEL